MIKLNVLKLPKQRNPSAMGCTYFRRDGVITLRDSAKKENADIKRTAGVIHSKRVKKARYNPPFL